MMYKVILDWCVGGEEEMGPFATVEEAVQAVEPWRTGRVEIFSPTTGSKLYLVGHRAHIDITVEGCVQSTAIVVES